MPRPHPPEFRQRAIQLARERAKSIATIAADLGISESCLRGWLHQPQKFIRPQKLTPSGHLVAEMPSSGPGGATGRRFVLSSDVTPPGRLTVVGSGAGTLLVMGRSSAA